MSALNEDILKYLSVSPFHLPQLFQTDHSAFMPLFEQEGTLLNLKKKDVIVSLNTQTDTVYILKDGLILESTTNPNGLEKSTLFFPAYPIAFLSSIHHLPTVYSVRAFTDAQVIAIPYTNYLKLMQQNLALIDVSLRFISFDSRNANTLVLQNYSCSTLEKIYQTIYCYHLACQYFAPLKAVTLTQSLLATLSGVHRTSVAHAIKQLKEEGIIKLEKKNLTVLAPETLLTMAFSNLL